MRRSVSRKMSHWLFSGSIRASRISTKLSHSGEAWNRPALIDFSPGVARMNKASLSMRRENVNIVNFDGTNSMTTPLWRAPATITARTTVAGIGQEVVPESKGSGGYHRGFDRANIIERTVQLRPDVRTPRRGAQELAKLANSPERLNSFTCGRTSAHRISSNIHPSALPRDNLFG